MGKTSESRGHWAEERAAQYLASKGYEILAVRYRCRSGEIDLIAKDGDITVFAEVKYRSSLLYGNPVEAVNGEKQRKIRKCADVYIHEAGTKETGSSSGSSYRFDVIGMWREGDRLKVRHLKGAF